MSWQRKNYIEHQLAAVWQKSHFLLLSPVSIAIRPVEAIAIVSVPGISLSRSLSSSIGSGLGLSRPLSVVSIAIRPVIATIAISSVAIAIISVPGISISIRGSSGSSISSGLSFSRPLSVVSIAIRSVIATIAISSGAIAIVSIPGISISIRGSSGSSISSGLSFSGPLSVVSIAIVSIAI